MLFVFLELLDKKLFFFSQPVGTCTSPAVESEIQHPTVLYFSIDKQLSYQT